MGRVDQGADSKTSRVVFADRQLYAAKEAGQNQLRITRTSAQAPKLRIA